MLENIYVSFFENFRNFKKISIWLGGAAPQTPRVLAGGAKPPLKRSFVTFDRGGQMRPPRSNDFCFGAADDTRAADGRLAGWTSGRTPDRTPGRTLVVLNVSCLWKSTIDRPTDWLIDRSSFQSIDQHRWRQNKMLPKRWEIIWKQFQNCQFENG